MHTQNMIRRRYFHTCRYNHQKINDTHATGTSTLWKSRLGGPLGSLARPPIDHYAMLKLTQDTAGVPFVLIKRR